MRKILMIVMMLFLMVFFLEAGDLPVKENETIEKNLTFAGGTEPQTLKIDNIFGSISVSGYSGKTVRLTAQKTIRAKTNQTLENAKKEVKLDISTKGNSIDVVVDGPFRDKEGRCNWKTHKLGYIVQYDFQVKVPFKTGLDVKTVNKGDVDVNDIQGKSTIKNVNGKITVKNLKGDFLVHTVNGRIKMEGITGSGEAHTVNGKVTVLFDKNPDSDCSFKTINGNLELDCLPGLSGDFKLKTFNGKIYSDFPATYLPSSPGKGERKKGKYVYKSSRFKSVRIGNGGPAIKMDTLNGNIIISKI
ncbi:MAG: hypothetical protein JSV88_14295 [Candidatus Aminicenantes bacterium]|nr:MAG: hypothetical protein JSV88_14295 [Candidatus Aminicenantes bacterium]